jgi:hypothetical protein
MVILSMSKLISEFRAGKANQSDQLKYFIG